ncbi:MAG: hypothetical protein E6K42_01595 [Gammaproteobacteria bacterium]|nr:MAG: hypothetical protein E6K42_01595 [Gammaproteobacteria bacterium]
MSDESHAPEERKVSSLAQLARSIEPGRDLWPQIEARINAEHAPRAAAAREHAGPRRPMLWPSLAAAMVASVAVGVWIGRSVLPTPGSPAGTSSPASAARGSAGLLGEPTAFDAAYVSDPRYLRERTALIRDLEARLASLPPAAREKVVKSLTAIRRAKEDLESALGKDPSSALLQELLVNTYQDEMRVLTDLHQASEADTGI